MSAPLDEASDHSATVADRQTDRQTHSAMDHSIGKQNIKRNKEGQTDKQT